MKNKNFYYSSLGCVLGLLLASSASALIVDDFDDKDLSGNPVSAQSTVKTDGTLVSYVADLSNVIGGCRNATIDGDYTGDNNAVGSFFISGTPRYSHSQDAGITAKSTLVWGDCEGLGTYMDEVDLTKDDSNYIGVTTSSAAVSPSYDATICVALTDSSNNRRAVCNDITTSTSYSFLYSKFTKPGDTPAVDLTKIVKIELIINGEAFPDFDLTIYGIATGNTDPEEKVCDVVPVAPHYGQKDECGLCPNEEHYGDGKDECNFCPNGTLPENYQYGDGKICSLWCPTVENPGKSSYLCTECDNGVDDDGDLKTDYPDDPNCKSSDDDSETPECSDTIDNDGDGKIDADDPECKDENGTYDPDLDDEGDVAACNDGVDNDFDTLIDDKDPGCYDKNPSTNQYEYNPYKKSEEGPTTQCADKEDNDSDNYIDSEDPGCWYNDAIENGGTVDYSSLPFKQWNPWDNDEGPNYQCSNGIDDDADGEIDADDTGCLDAKGKWNPRDNDERTSIKTPECNDGIDNDADGKIDYPDDPGCSSKDDDSEKTLPECSDTVDNDGDGNIDAADPECWVDGAYDPEGVSEAACVTPTSKDSLTINNARLAAIGENDANYLIKFYKNSSAEYKRTTISAQRVAKKILKQIKQVQTDLSNFNISCTSSEGYTCRTSNDKELDSFSKSVNSLSTIVRRAQRRGLFFYKNYENKAVPAKKRKKAAYKKTRQAMLNTRKARTREKLVSSLNQSVSNVKALDICDE